MISDGRPDGYSSRGRDYRGNRSPTGACPLADEMVAMFGQHEFVWQGSARQP
jgi:hypothetical protein